MASTIEMKRRMGASIIRALVIAEMLLLILLAAPLIAMSQNRIGVVTYREDAQPQRIYAFFQGYGGTLSVNYWNGSQWNCADQGTPPGTTVGGAPGVITYREGAQPQRI